MKKLISLFVIGIFTVSMSGWTLINDGAIHTSYNTFEPVDPDMIYIPCVGEFGEDVLLEGTVHNHGTTTMTPSGNVHASYHSNLQGVVGTGLITGNTYHFTSNQNGQINLNVGEVTTITFNSMLVSNGTQFVNQVRQQYTVNANGEVVVDTFFLETSCN